MFGARPLRISDWIDSSVLQIQNLALLTRETLSSALGMEDNKENIDTLDDENTKDTMQLSQGTKIAEDGGNTTKTLTNIEDIQGDRKRRRSSYQKRVSFGGSQIKIFDRNEDEWNGNDQVDNNYDSSETNRQSNKNNYTSILNIDASDTITIPSLSSLLKDTEGETSEWKMPDGYSVISNHTTSKEDDGYSQETEEFDDVANTNNSLSFFMDEDVSKAAKLPRVSLGDTTIFPSSRRNYENSTQLNSFKQETKDYDTLDTTYAEITEKIPKLHDLLEDDETLTSNWESVRKSIETYQNSAANVEDDADASFEKMYGRVFGSPSGKSPENLYNTKEMSAEITKSIPSLRMLMEEDTTISLPRMPVNASDLKNIQRQIQMDDTEDKRIPEKGNEKGEFRDYTEDYDTDLEGKLSTEAPNEDDWSISTTDFRSLLQSERGQHEEDEIANTTEEPNRDYTWPVSRPQMDNDDWTLQNVAHAQETPKDEKTPKFRFVKKPPVYTPNRKVQTESKNNRIPEHHEPSRNNATVQSTKPSTAYTPSPTSASINKEITANSTMKSSGQNRKQSLEFRRKSIAAHVKRLSTLPSTKSNAYDSTPSNNNWNAGHWDNLQKQEVFGDDDDSELHALTEIFMASENETNKNSTSKQPSHNVVSEFLQEAKVRFLDNVSSRRRQTSYGVYTTDDHSASENEETKIVAVTGSYGWLKKLEGLCEKLETSCFDTETRITSTESDLNKDPPELLCKVSKRDFPKQQLTRLQISMKRLKNFCRLEARCRWYERRLQFESELASELEYWISCFKEEMKTMESNIESLQRLSLDFDDIAMSEKLRLQSYPPAAEEQRELEPIIASLREQESVREGFLNTIESLEKEITQKEDEKQKIQQEGSLLSKRRQSLEQYVLSSSDAAKTNAKSIQDRFELYCRLLGISIRQINKTCIDVVVLNRLNMKIGFDSHSHIFCQSNIVSKVSDMLLLNNCIAPFVSESIDYPKPMQFRNNFWSTIYKLTLVNLIEQQLKSIKSLYIVSTMEKGLGFVVESLFASSKLGWKFLVRCQCEDLWHLSPIVWEIDSVFGQCEQVSSLKDQLNSLVTETSPLVDGMKEVRQWLYEKATSLNHIL
ncbi:hypothetical protein GpartN1_g2923.t1 [Galdieria partita]|uniref:Spc7 kinetochore protein domain-containing protein n=1 Tax=Galdieria partita TaxID=83374 RepID=A0A9C7PWC7_9RHOD|nr:hypothetical protein GpartN1_g2923.t1 [Galdieria partita]